MYLKRGDTVRYIWEPVPAIVLSAYKDMVDLQFANGDVINAMWTGHLTPIPKKEYFREALKHGQHK